MHESYPERNMEDLTSSDEVHAAESRPTGYGAPEPGETSAGQSGAGQGDQTSDRMHEQTSQAMDKAQQQAGQAVDKVQQQAAQQAAGQKDRLAQGLQSTAHALTQMSRQLRDNEQDTIARYTDMAAERVRQASDYLSTQDIRDLMDDVEDFARRQPALVLGGAFALGVLTARFLKSSRPSSGRTYQGSQGYRGNRRQTGYGNTMVGERPSSRPYPGTGYGTGYSRGTGVD